jgi:CRP-like cAMP-binding protein
MLVSEVRVRWTGHFLAISRSFDRCSLLNGPANSISSSIRSIFPSLVPLRLTQSDLASLIGASRVRVNQALNFYKQRTYLSLNRANQILIHNSEALSRRCS